MRQYQGYDELDDRPAAKVSNGKRPRRASLLGGLAVLVGFAAVAVSQRDKLNELASHYDAPFAGCLFEIQQYAVHPYHVAAAAAGIAVLALLFRRMTGRTRAGLPLFALMLAGIAAGTFRYEHSPREVGSPERWVQDNVVEKAQQWWANRGEQPATPAVELPASTPTDAASPTTQPSGKKASAGGKSDLFGL